MLHNLDRIEDRLRDAPDGLHSAGPPASRAAIAASGLTPEVALLWATYDGLDLAGGECRIFALAEHAPATAAAEAEGRLRPGDRVVGERERDLLVLCADPHAEGADVVLVEEDGERLPLASSVDRLVLALLGEFSVLFDEDGEYQADLFGDDGRLTQAAERRLLRRHLDLDPDAPLARFRLAQSLRRAGELRGAAAELKQLLRRAPEFLWGHHELGRVRLAEATRPEGAVSSFRRAAELAAEPGLRAYCLAWACLALQSCTDAQAARTGQDLAAAALAASPGLPAAHEAAAREALESEDLHAAEEQLGLGLAVAPGHLGLLSLRAPLAELRERVAGAAPPEPLEADPDAGVDPALLEDDAARRAPTPAPSASPERPRTKADRAPDTGSASSPYGGRRPAKNSGDRRSRRPARPRG